jgi:hypothetical protein
MGFLETLQRDGDDRNLVRIIDQWEALEKKSGRVVCYDEILSWFSGFRFETGLGGERTFGLSFSGEGETLVPATPEARARTSAFALASLVRSSSSFPALLRCER